MGWEGKGSRHERGYGSQWVKARARVLARDTYLCQPCMKAGRTTTATEVDHVKPKAKGGTDDDDNLVAICRSCHRDKTAREAAEAQGHSLKPRISFDAKGYPVW
jgi:5-methylcytosine-specific restriction enzyme A